MDGSKHRSGRIIKKWHRTIDGILFEIFNFFARKSKQNKTKVRGGETKVIGKKKKHLFKKIDEKENRRDYDNRFFYTSRPIRQFEKSKTNKIQTP